MTGSHQSINALITHSGRTNTKKVLQPTISLLAHPAFAHVTKTLQKSFFYLIFFWSRGLEMAVNIAKHLTKLHSRFLELFKTTTSFDAVTNSVSVI